MVVKFFRFTPPGETAQKIMMATDIDGNRTGVLRCEECVIDCESPIDDDCNDGCIGTDRAAKVMVTIDCSTNPSPGAFDGPSCVNYPPPTTTEYTQCEDMSGTYILEFVDTAVANRCLWQLTDIPFNDVCLSSAGVESQTRFPAGAGLLDISLHWDGTATSGDLWLLALPRSLDVLQFDSFSAGRRTIGTPQLLPDPPWNCLEFEWDLVDDWISPGSPVIAWCIGSATVRSMS